MSTQYVIDWSGDDVAHRRGQQTDVAVCGHAIGEVFWEGDWEPTNYPTCSPCDARTAPSATRVTKVAMWQRDRSTVTPTPAAVAAVPAPREPETPLQLPPRKTWSRRAAEAEVCV